MKYFFYYGLGVNHFAPWICEAWPAAVRQSCRGAEGVWGLHRLGGGVGNCGGIHPSSEIVIYPPISEILPKYCAISKGSAGNYENGKGIVYPLLLTHFQHGLLFGK